MAGVASLFTSERAVKITTGVAFPLCRALHVGTAGTATLVQPGGTATDFPLQAGVNYVACTTVTLGTAADVWAMY
jgi:hypothetical protein